jgi:DNA-binding NtrC family response regulator
MPHALVLDDDPDVLRPLAKLVEREGFTVRTSNNLANARAELANGPCDVLIADLQLPDGVALELLPELEQRPGTDLIVITGHSSVDSAIEAFRGGAIDYFLKPVDTQYLCQLLRKIVKALELRGEVDLLRSELRRAGRFGKLIGAAPVMQALYDQIERVAPTNATVLIQGETGTGKELVAETVHRMSRRAKDPFVAVNCGAVADTLIESELFGHEKGSFTGATKRHAGVFERANGGSLFLDEITEMPLELQVRLLRVLETRKVRRIGGEADLEVDARVMCATNQNAEKAVRDGKLREDLYFRLAVFPIEVPPLRDRSDDIGLIAEHVLAKLNEDAGASKQLAPEAAELLRAQPWPGNVRELRNCVERAFIMSGDRIGVDALPFGADVGAGNGAGPERAGVWSPVGTPLANAERDLVLATVQHIPDKGQAAKALGISLKTLYNRLHKYGAMDS